MENLAARTHFIQLPALDAPDESETRLNALLAANAEIARGKQLLRRESDEYEAALMRRPFSPAAAYGFFGLMLGTLPPAAIFYRMFAHDFRSSEWLVFSFFMNLMCAFVGYKVGKMFAPVSADLERKSWTKMLLLMPFIGAAWAILTGAAGGVLVFGIGAIFGMICALPVGVVAFPLFAVLHRLLQRAGQIERKHLLPFAVGVSMMISAFILGM